MDTNNSTHSEARDMASTAARGTRLIGTHNGVFHCDDVVAVAALKLIWPGSEVVRTRDQKTINSCNVVVDVGAVYDREKDRFDHHQAGRAGARPNGVLYSSAGLVWEKYDPLVVSTVLDAGPAEALLVSARVDAAFMQPIDAIDNGQALYEGGKPKFEGIASLGFSAAISSMNPTWNEATRDFDAAFSKAVELAKIFLVRAIHTAQGEDLAVSLVNMAIQEAKDERLLVFDKFCPWVDVAVKSAPKALYAVFPSETGTWMVQCIPDALGSFGKRKALPEAWAGLRDEEFQMLTGVVDGVFCHPGLFICGAKTREGALELARQALS